MSIKLVVLYLGYWVFVCLTGFLGAFLPYLTGSSWSVKEVTLSYITLHLFDKHMLSHYWLNELKKCSLMLLAYLSVGGQSYMIASPREGRKRCWFLILSLGS